MQTIYFASIAHDLRTPLNAMLAATQTLRSSNLPERFNEILNMQETSTKFLMNLVEDILVRFLELIDDRISLGLNLTSLSSIYPVSMSEKLSKRLFPYFNTEPQLKRLSYNSSLTTLSQDPSSVTRKESIKSLLT